LATLFFISQGADFQSPAISMMILPTFVFVMINSFDFMGDLKANGDDLDAEEATTQFRSEFRKELQGMFEPVVTILFGATALAQRHAIWRLFCMNERAEQSAPHAHLFNDYSGLNLKLS
jgi:hypothetical protein